MFEILKMSSDNCGIGNCGGNISRLSDGFSLSDGIRVRLGFNVVHVIENDICTSVPLRRTSCNNKADRSRLVGGFSLGKKILSLIQLVCDYMTVK